MDLSYSDEYERFRDEVRGFVAAHWPPPEGGSTTEQEALFRARATDAGYLYRNVPRQYGGSEQPADLLTSEIIRQEFRRAGAPVERNDRAITRLIPTLLRWGSEWQKDFFIRPTLTGEVLWAQGYSEPNAGSDLASLRTRAELIDERWVVNGQKIWSSRAQLARYMYLLVRTEPEPRHAGISYLLIDLHQPGVDIRPIRQLNGDAEFSEVFFTDAAAPADWLVGERGRGWEVSRTTLKHERSGMHSVNWLESLLRRLVKLARESRRGGAPAIEDREVRRRLAEVQARLFAMRYSTYRSLSMEAVDEDPGGYTYMSKLYLTETLHGIVAVARDLLGDDLMLEKPGRAFGHPGNHKWIAQASDALKIAIAGGSSNIQLNIIGERVLALPRDAVGASR